MGSWKFMRNSNQWKILAAKSIISSIALLFLMSYHSLYHMPAWRLQFMDCYSGCRSIFTREVWLGIQDTSLRWSMWEPLLGDLQLDTSGINSKNRQFCWLHQYCLAVLWWSLLLSFWLTVQFHTTLSYFWWDLAWVDLTILSVFDLLFRHCNGDRSWLTVVSFRR